MSHEYPAANYRGAARRFESRRLRVDRVRIIADQPLDPATITLDPELCRSETLVIGTDLDKGEERSFYLERFANLTVLDASEFQSIEVFVVMIEEPSGDDRPCIVDFDIERSRRVAYDFNSKPPTSGARAMVYPISAAILKASSNRRLA